MLPLQSKEGMPKMALASQDTSLMVRSHLRELPPYEPILPYEVLSETLGIPVEALVKLDANENPYGALPAIQQALGQLAYLHIYPDPESRELRRKLAGYHQVPFDNLLAGAGADELIDLILRVLVDPHDSVINCPPTFGMYAFDALLQDAQVINVPRKPDFSLDLPAIISAIEKHQPKLLFLASPNNPDGSQTPLDEIEQLLAQPVILVLDEAYNEFSGHNTSMIQQVCHYNNLIVLRTFSKWAGLAGLRVGYGAFPSSLMPFLWKCKQPYNVSVAAAAAASIALDHQQELTHLGQKIIAERERLFALLAEITWLEPYPSQTNFILCKVLGKDALELKNQLAQAGILVRHFNKPGLQAHIRISVGTPQQSDILLNRLRSRE